MKLSVNEEEFPQPTTDVVVRQDPGFPEWEALQQQREKELALLQTITKLVNASIDFHELLAIILKNVCETLGWNLGEAWLPSTDESVLECSPVWYSNSDTLEEFRLWTKGFVFSAGAGLPGRVWLSKQPEWNTNVSQESNILFFRASLATQVGLKSALGVPVLSRGEVLAVLVFFMFEDRNEDLHLVEIISAIAHQLGTLMYVKRMEQTYRASEARYRRILDDHERSEAKLQRYAQELRDTQHLVENRASELLADHETLKKVHKKLKKSEASLRDLNRSKDKLFLMIANNLQAPFAALLGLAEGLMHNSVVLSQTETSHMSERLMLSLQQVLQFADNLLQWSTLQGGLLRYSPQVLSLETLLQQSMSLLAEAYQQKSLNCGYTLEKPLTVFADPHMVQSILHNLLSNAVKFTPLNGTIRLLAFQKNKDVEIHVVDTGKGMTSQELALLFDWEKCPQQREAPHGIGMGLLLCKELVEQNHGRLWAESQPGQGSTFKLTLPLANS